MEVPLPDKENEIVIHTEDDRKPAALPSPGQRKHANEENFGEDSKLNKTTERCDSVVKPTESAPAKPLTSKEATLNQNLPVISNGSRDDPSVVNLSGAHFNCEKRGPPNSLHGNHRSSNNDAATRVHKKPRAMHKNQDDTSSRPATIDTVIHSDNKNAEGSFLVPSQGKTDPFLEDTDHELAASLQQRFYEEGGHSTSSPRGTYSVEQDLDFQLAMSLQQEEYENPSKGDSNEKKSGDINEVFYDKAISVVEKILRLVQTTKEKYQLHSMNFDSVSSNDMVFLANDLLKAQVNFAKEGTSAYVDVGFHYTNSTNLNSIHTNGLMTKNERDSQGITSDRFNGSTYGDGVYTANDPLSFANYGDTGLIVGRLLGSVKSYMDRTGNENTVLVPHLGMIVMKTSVQCLPMIKYDKPLVTLEEGTALVNELQKSLQVILDEIFNPGLTAPKFEVVRPPTTAARVNRAMTSLLPPALQYIAPQKISVDINNDLIFCRPPSLFNFQSDCPICLDALAGPQYCVALKVCNHVFHKGCMQQACQFSLKCPTCRISIGKPLGKSPTGSMTVNVSTYVTCGGYENCGTIEIVYSMLAGLQKHYHENPGEPHQGKHAIAYLPDNADGQNLLKRLKFAFMHGLTFTVGTSMTTGVANQCTWASIHHKTFANARAHGFPDPNYFANCNGELDNMYVPAADELDANGKKLLAGPPGGLTTSAHVVPE